LPGTAASWQKPAGKSSFSAWVVDYSVAKAMFILLIESAAVEIRPKRENRNGIWRRFFRIFFGFWPE
jgi:hypothetical protein